LSSVIYVAGTAYRSKKQKTRKDKEKNSDTSGSREGRPDEPLKVTLKRQEKEKIEASTSTSSAQISSSSPPPAIQDSTMENSAEPRNSTDQEILQTSGDESSLEMENAVKEKSGKSKGKITSKPRKTFEGPMFRFKASDRKVSIPSQGYCTSGFPGKHGKVGEFWSKALRATIASNSSKLTF